MERQENNNIDLRSYLRKSPYLKQNIKKFAPQHEIMHQIVENNLPVQNEKKMLQFNNSKNIFGQKNLKQVLASSSICYTCGQVQNAFNKCQYCNKVICDKCLVRCQHCQRLVCQIDSRYVYERQQIVCYDCC